MAQFAMDGRLINPNFQDPAFEPQPNFDFDDGQHGEDGMRAMHHGMASLNTFNGQQPQFQNNGDFSIAGPEGVLSSPNSMFPPLNDGWEAASMPFDGVLHNPGALVDPTDVLDKPVVKPHAELGISRTSQSDIVRMRNGRVREQYGNLTPPEDDAVMDSGSCLPQPTGSDERPRQAMDRSERARNAAMQRHAKTKRQAQRESKRSDGDSDDCESAGPGDKREKYREKNRAAAAKCRAKKKTHVEKIELDARSLETENALLKARVRDLRNQHAELRDLALQHNQSVTSCHCTPLHQYNMSKAAEITSSFTAFAAMRPVSTPSQDSISSTMASPGCLDMDSRKRMSGAGPSMMPGLPDPRVYGSSSNMAFARMSSPENAQMESLAMVDEHGQQYSNFQ